MGLFKQYKDLQDCWDAAEHLEELKRQGADTAKIAEAHNKLTQAQQKAPKWSR